MADELIPQHKNMAMGKGILPDESFGTENAFKQVGGEQGPPRGTLRDSQRSITRPRGFHPEPDHGESY